MTKFKGTKGEWKITEYWTDREIEIGTNEQPCCALIDRRYFKNKEECIYNSKLIASAPEMLEILQTIENDKKQVPEWLWNKIQSVIKKATE